MSLQRWARLMPGLWAGWLLCAGLLATPAPFALLARAEAGRVVSRMLAQEAYTSLALGIVLLIVERVIARRRVDHHAGSQFSTEMVLVLGTLLCTVLGYFAVQPMMDAARAGAGPLGFGALHAISSTFYVVKVLLVVALAWRRASPVNAPA